MFCLPSVSCGTQLYESLTLNASAAAPASPAIDFHITLLYVFIYFKYFFLSIIDEPQEDERGPLPMLILSLNLLLLSDGFNGG